MTICACHFGDRARLPIEVYEGLLGIVQGKAPLSHGLNGAYVECVLQL